MEQKRLYRSTEDKMIAGVCGGIAEYFKVDTVWVRIIAVLLLFIDGIGIIAYIIAWIIIPKNPNQKGLTQKTKKESKPKKGQKIKSVSVKKQAKLEMKTSKKDDRCGSHFFGIVLVGLGAFFLINEFVPGFEWSIFWPVVLILLGIYVIMKKRRCKK